MFINKLFVMLVSGGQEAATYLSQHSFVNDRPQLVTEIKINFGHNKECKIRITIHDNVLCSVIYLVTMM